MYYYSTPPFPFPLFTRRVPFQFPVPISYAHAPSDEDDNGQWPPRSSSASSSILSSSYSAYTLEGTSPQPHAALEQFIRQNLAEWLGTTMTDTEPISLSLIPSPDAIPMWQLATVAIYTLENHRGTSAAIRAALEAAFAVYRRPDRNDALKETLKNTLSAYNIFHRMEIQGGGRQGMWGLNITTDPFGRRPRAPRRGASGLSSESSSPEAEDEPVILHQPYSTSG
ncbi:hypothetical protein CYLTODRAFT_410938 [Cylindrobasidium torrendii FP15055 ss-10]|uniref:Fork-head domain-containing protein n=1 Tax=Cylindrobasidium torrendii FP15055 ss-10 TaxID=1314674 RepID=A0A0D7BB26_9AGAR|nr:hypothetical protein CYLTODRAFT_410938 [Cylindrobasidium torrendii FP15055 ss-10]